MPNGMEQAKLVNPKLDMKALSKLNKLREGNATKLILLLKYWNIYWDKPLKSYLIERLVEYIFSISNINGWDKGVKTFFYQSVQIFEKNIMIPDRAYKNESILDDYSNEMFDNFYETLKEARSYATQNKWKDLFDDDVDIDITPLAILRDARKIQQIFDDLLTSARSLLDGIEVVHEGLIIPDITFQKLCEGDDSTERIVDLMSHATGQHPDSGHLLLLDRLAL